MMELAKLIGLAVIIGAAWGTHDFRMGDKPSQKFGKVVDGIFSVLTLSALAVAIIRVAVTP